MMRNRMVAVEQKSDGSGWRGTKAIGSRSKTEEVNCFLLSPVADPRLLYKRLIAKAASEISCRFVFHSDDINI